MFTCCVPVFRGSRLRKAQSVRLLCCCGHRIKPHGQFGRRYPKVMWGSPGQPTVGQDTTRIPPEQPHSPCTLCEGLCVTVGVCVYTWALCGKAAGEEWVPPGQEESVMCCQPGESVILIPRGLAGSLSSWVLGSSCSALVLILRRRSFI